MWQTRTINGKKESRANCHQTSPSEWNMLMSQVESEKGGEKLMNILKFLISCIKKLNSLVDGLIPSCVDRFV